MPRPRRGAGGAAVMPSLVVALLWFLAADLLALIPPRGGFWGRVYILGALGVPLAGWITYQNGPWIGLLMLALGASVLRWPLIRLAQDLRRRGGDADG